jgi:hypothetical protein
MKSLIKGYGREKRFSSQMEVSLSRQPHFKPQGILISVRGWVDPQGVAETIR